MEIILSLDAKLCLTKMSLIYERVEGQRIKLSQITDIVTLVNSSLEAVNEEYKRYYDTFVRHLTQNEVRELVAQGAVIYRGAVVPEASEQPAPSQQPSRTITTYRGIATIKEEAPAKAESAAPSTPSKKRRIYRGQVIED